MSGILRKRIDGSYALLIENDLQFDSRDEVIYHESLTLPALSLALGRFSDRLDVLVIGGGDGLVARELFKSDRIRSVDLVDYDAQIVEYGRRDLWQLNQSSLSHSSLTIHVRDAWGYVDEVLKNSKRFHLIICDLTVPQNLEGCRFHTIDWYKRLFSIVHDNAIVAINGCSPQATPRAFSSILNSVLKAQFHVRPYHVSIPSFSQMGYGADWGFLIASPTSIEKEEFDHCFEEIKPRHWLTDVAAVRRLFLFPKIQFDAQSIASPANVGSGILLHYFQTDRPLSEDVAAPLDLDVFDLDTGTMLLPEPDAGMTVSPTLMRAALCRAMRLADDTPTDSELDAQAIVGGVIALMPELSGERTFEMVDTFLRNPMPFLQDLDLRRLVNTLLARAAELPSSLVAELECLRERLVSWADDNLTVLNLGQRLLVILSLVIVLGNLLYPDMVYAKGHAGGGSHGAAGHAAGHAGHASEGNHHPGAGAGRRAGAAGRRGGWGGWGGWGGGGTWTGPGYQQPLKRGPIGPGPSSHPPAPAQIKNYGPSGYKTPDRTVASGINSYTLGGPVSQPENKMIAFEQTASPSDLMRQQRRASANKDELSGHVAQLRSELAELESSQDSIVVFGTHSMSRTDAIRRTTLSIAKLDSEIELLNKQVVEIALRLDNARSDSSREDSNGSAS